jgi:hypothetical protein
LEEEVLWNVVQGFLAERVGLSNYMLPSFIGSVRICFVCWSLDVDGGVLSVATRRCEKEMEQRYGREFESSHG